MNPHRIAAGAIIFRERKVLLVRYRDSNGDTYLVAPGGASELHESVADAAVRETKEETDIEVEALHIIAVEDLICSRFKMCKIWLLCRFISGNVRQTTEAEKEGIIEAGWFTRSELDTEIVYPSLLKDKEWDAITNESRKACVFPIRKAGF